MSDSQSFVFEVQNLSCASCVGRAQKALEAVPGVSHAAVNLANHTAHVEGMPDAHAIGDALAAAGYPARSRKVQLKIDGMTCASCVSRVETALQAVPGTIEARVNLANNSAHVVTLSRDDAALISAVAQAGYAAKSRADADPDAAAEHAAYLARMTVLAGVLALPVFVAEMGGHVWPALHHWFAQTIGMTTLWTIEFLLTTVVLAVPGRQFFTIGLPALWHRRPEMNSLVAIGTLAAWGYSTTSLFAPALLPEGSRDVYFESAAVIVTLILLGR
jgi:Cu+-exporting ATPase